MIFVRNGTLIPITGNKPALPLGVLIYTCTDRLTVMINSKIITLTGVSVI